MAECKLTAQEFIQNTFAPTVAVLCSPDAERLCQKNNLSFVELVQPFCRLTAEAHVHDPNGIQHTVQQLRVLFRHMNDTPPQPTLSRKLFSEAVSSALPSLDGGRSVEVMTVGHYDLQLSPSTPWFEAFREKYLQFAYPADHEYLTHYLACVFVVSSSNANAMDQFARLKQQQHQQQHQQPHKLPRWFCPNIFTYYVLLCDVVEEPPTRAEAIYQSMKTAYGTNSCHLLQINSRPPESSLHPAAPQGTLPDPWAQFLPRKSASSDAVDYVSVANLAETNSTAAAFPDVVSECNVEQTLVEDAKEASEDGVDSVPDVVDHPLAPSSRPANGLIDADPSPTPSHVTVDGYASSSSLLADVKDGPTPAQRGQCLTLSDHDRLRIFVHEFVVRSLIPWAERMLRTLAEQVATRKGIHRSLFSATKKWFGGNKPIVNTVAAEKANVVYTPEAPEMQLRRLGDLAFVFQLYELAYQTYHTAKRDFNNDHAWLHYAGALEMACMSVFLQGSSSQRQYPHHYMESAISTYLTTCRAPNFATRATLLSTEALKSKGMYAEAAMLFIKMTSEDSDLRSGLLLEQAAHCFLRMQPPMVRKYAFHMILSGHRFSKAAQKRHALRAYMQALQVYKGRSWSLAEDHINFTIGRQCFNLKQLGSAAATFRHLLTAASKQPSAQQIAFLREFLFVYKQQLASLSEEGSTIAKGELPQLPLPIVDSNSTKVLCVRAPQAAQGDRQPATSVYFDHNENENSTWQWLEEQAVVSRGDGLPLDFTPCIQCYTNRTSNTKRPLVVVEEPVTIEVCLRNPLSVAVVLQQVQLLWRFVPYDSAADENQSAVTYSNEITRSDKEDRLVENQVITELTMEPEECRLVHLRLMPRQMGDLCIAGVICRLASESTPTVSGGEQPVGGANVLGKLALDPQGPRLNGTKEEKSGFFYAIDRRLDLRVVPHMPELEVTFCGFPTSMLCGEARRVTLELHNRGRHALLNMRLMSTQPRFATFGQANFPATTTTTAALDVPIERLQAGGSTSLPLWIHGPATPGLHIIHLLFYYESAERNSEMSYRILRHTVELNLQASLHLQATANRGSHHGMSRAAHDNVDSVTLLLEIQNVNSEVVGRDLQAGEVSVNEFTLQQVTCVSDDCRLEHLSTTSQSIVQVKAQETALMCFKVYKQLKATGGKKSSMVFSSAVFEKHKIVDVDDPYTDFYYRSKFSQSFHATESTESVTPDTAVHSPTWADSSRHVAITLIVLWKANVVDDAGKSHMITGHHQLDIETIDQPVTSTPVLKMLTEQPPVKLTRSLAPPTPGQPEPTAECASRLLDVSLQYSQRVQHDFSNRRLCFVAVTILMQNLSDVTLNVQVNPCIEQEKPEVDTPPSGHASIRPSHALRWTSLATGCQTFAPYARGQHRLQACVCQPGVYDLASVCIWASRANRDLGCGAENGVMTRYRQHYGPAVLIVTATRTN